MPRFLQHYKNLLLDGLTINRIFPRSYTSCPIYNNDTKIIKENRENQDYFEPDIHKATSRLNPRQYSKFYNISQPTNRNILLVLDLNGTLLLRRKKRQTILLRPGVTDFIDFALKNFAVMVWSSAQPNNVDKMVKHLFGKKKSLLAGVWDRRFCTLRGNYFSKSKCIKDMERIWNGWTLDESSFKHLYVGTEYQFIKTTDKLGLDNGSDVIKKKFQTKWNSENTLLVDDSVGKAQKQPFNHLCISEYNETNLQSDMDLVKLKEYLEKMVLIAKNFDTNASEEKQDNDTNIRFDVRKYVEANPFICESTVTSDSDVENTEFVEIAGNSP
ncbi:hypothetical protein BB558_005138 [Smittium angustum]|uniref:Mitochondrial import inner membrane translocase subunit TIM50 n=1 Tax=Smittium angustum TaxID=133377 RepID=A0A2U1J1B0_SMIAN|nr:hypothetical protein BB558_005138 [Smittium angustum]